MGFYENDNQNIYYCFLFLIVIANATRLYEKSLGVNFNLRL